MSKKQYVMEVNARLWITWQLFMENTESSHGGFFALMDQGSLGGLFS